MTWVSDLVRFGGATSVVMADAASGYTPTVDEYRARLIRVTGAQTAIRPLILPLKAGADWDVSNETTGGFDVLVKGASGTGVSVPAGSRARVLTDGTNFSSTAVNDTTDGLGTFLRKIKSYTPLGTSADASNIQALINTAGVEEVRIRSGTATVSAPLILKPKQRLLGAGIESTILLSSVPNLGHTSSANDDKLIYTATAYATPGTLAGTPTLYGRTFTSTTDMAKGTWVFVSTALASAPLLYCQLFQIVGKSGGPTVTYTVDRAIVRPFASGDTVAPAAILNEEVELGGMTICGTGTRAFNSLQGVRNYLHDLLIRPDDATGNVFGEAASFDTGHFDCVAERVRIRGIPGHGLSMESGERIRFHDCTADACTSNGFNSWDSIDSVLSECSASGCTGAGALVGGDNNIVAGSLGVRVVGGSFTNNTSVGIQIGQGSKFNVVGVKSEGNGGTGILIQGADATTQRAFDVTLTGCESKNDNRVSQSITLGGITVQNTAGLAINGNTIDGSYCSGFCIGVAVTSIAGDVGKITNIVLAGGRRAGLLHFGSGGATGTIIGMFVDTATTGVFIESAAVSPGLFIDELTVRNVTNRVANAANAVIDGIKYKADQATTVDVSGRVRLVYCADTIATTITNPMVNADDQQEVTYTATNGNTTINRSTSVLAASANWVSTANGYSSIGLIYRSGPVLACERWRATNNG